MFDLLQQAEKYNVLSPVHKNVNECRMCRSLSDHTADRMAVTMEETCFDLLLHASCNGFTVAKSFPPHSGVVVEEIKKSAEAMFPHRQRAEEGSRKMGTSFFFFPRPCNAFALAGWMPTNATWRCSFETGASTERDEADCMLHAVKMYAAA